MGPVHAGLRPCTPPAGQVSPSRKKACDVPARVDEGHVTSSQTMECPICYDVIAEGAAHSTPCGHVFHQACMTSWLERATTCPTCRTTIAEAPANPEAEPVWLGWFEERHRVMGERLAAHRASLQSIAAGLESVRVGILEAEAALAARKAKRSAAAKRGAATRAANRAARVTCNTAA